MLKPSLNRCLVTVCSLVALLTLCLPAQAATLDDYVLRYLKASEPVPMAMNSQGETRAFSAADFSEGKRLFEDSCLSCHVGGATVQNPAVSLSLADLEGATPPRNTISSLVAFQRQPLTYDGQDLVFWCRQVSEHWMSDEELEKLAAFILRAAEVAPSWGKVSLSL